MCYEEFRKEVYCSLDKDMFLRKPIQNKDLLEKINTPFKESGLW
jgi:hypothetical protein